MSRVSQDRRPMSTVGADPRWAEIEVTAKATRRRFTLDYKRKIVQEADRCKTSGAVGALLRREGLYSSHLTTWRAARERGDLADRTVKKRGPVPRVRDPRDKRITELGRENAFWRKRAERAEALIEVQKTSRSGPTFTSTSCSTSSAATWSAGWSPIARAPCWLSGSSTRRVPVNASGARSSSRFTPTVVR